MQNDIYNINKQIKNICEIIILNLIRISPKLFYIRIETNITC